MIIRKATECDFNRIMEIYAHARSFMAQTGNPRQWGATNWPPEALIHTDITRGTSYVCEEEGRVVAVFYYDKGQSIEPCYDTIEGTWEGSEEYGVVHRIASDGTVKGAGGFCINWAFEQCGNIRMDTHEDNKVMQNLLKKLEFRYAGITYVEEDNDPRLSYEKLL